MADQASAGGEPRDARGAAGYGRRLLGAAITGGLLAAVASVALGFLLRALAAAGVPPRVADAYRSFLAGGGWLWIPLWGAALGSLRAGAWAVGRRQRMAALVVALALAAVPAALRPVVDSREVDPRTPRAKARAILKWSYQSPATVARLLPLSRDPDRQVREQAMMALGVNLIVTDIERASMIRPSRYGDHPLRQRLRARLLEALRDDPDEAVRAEAARALWRAPLAFGRQPAAAETLAAMLDRASVRSAPGRPAWLALDAAAGAADSALIAAAGRFAESTTDSALKSAARRIGRAR